MGEGPQTQDVSSGSDGREPAFPVRLLAPGTQLGQRYEIRRVLGRGGQAVVYAAHDRELHRDVALKVLRTDRTSESALKRLRREVAVARDAESPRLVRVFDIVTAAETIFLTMEEVDGESLRELLATGPLGVDEALAIGAEVLRGLAVLHDLGIVHRDVKPGNVLISRTGQVKLADFGLARNLDRDESRATEADTLIGTVEYMAPEQAQGRDVDARADLYAFGAVLFEMLAGRVPFTGPSAVGVLLAQARQKAPDVRTFRPAVPAWLAVVVARLLEREPERRYASAREVLVDLAAARAPRRSRRAQLRRAAAALLAAAALASGWLAYRAAGRPRLARLVDDPDGGEARALDAEGRLLWSRRDIHAVQTSALARVPGRSQPLLAVILDPDSSGVDPRRRTLAYLEPDTGVLVSRERIPDVGAALFPGVAPTFGMGDLRVVDVDGDGVDEVVLGYIHTPSYPSYLVVHWPRFHGIALVLAASGHHLTAGAADVDGDGRQELLVEGPNNRMGRYTAFAAVRMQPPGGVDVGAGRVLLPASHTPDEQDLVPGARSIVWYALGPRHLEHRQTVVVEPGSRLLRFVKGTAVQMTLSFDGVSPGIAKDEVEEVLRSRNAAYASIRASLGSIAASDTAGSLAAAGKAVDLAARTGEPTLGEWARRVQLRALVAAGRTPEAEEGTARLLETSADRAEIAYDLATALGRAGRLERALAWYRRGFGIEAGPSKGGRPQRDYLDGAFLALGRMGRWDEARDEAVRMAGEAIDARSAREVYLEYASLRAGRRPSPLRALPWGAPDHLRYWALEVGLAAGVVPATLSAQVEAELAVTSTLKNPVASLAAELLARGGKVSEAADAARAAFEGGLGDRDRDPDAAVYVDWLAARAARLLERAGRRAEARAVRAEAAKAR